MHGFSDDCNSRFRIPEMGLVLTISHLMSLQKSLTSPFLDISLSSSLMSFRSRVGISHASNGKPPEIDWLTWMNQHRHGLPMVRSVMWKKKVIRTTIMPPSKLVFIIYLTTRNCTDEGPRARISPVRGL